MSTQAVNDAPENAVLQEQLDKIWRDTQGLGTLRGKMTDADFYDVAKDDTGALSVVGELANSAGRGFFKGLNNLAAAATDRKTFDAGVKHLIRAMPLGRDLGGLADMYNSVLIPPTKDKLQAGNLPALPKLNIPAASDLIPEDVLRRFNERRAKDYVGFDNWGANTCHGIYPKGTKAGLQHHDLGEVTLHDGNNGMYQGYRSHYKWDLGLSVRDWRYVVRIANVDVKKLTKDGKAGADLIDLMTQAVELIPNLNAGKAVFYCNREIRSILRRQIANRVVGSTLTMEEVAGKKVVAFDGIPVRICDQLLSTEERVK